MEDAELDAYLKRISNRMLIDLEKAFPVEERLKRIKKVIGEGQKPGP